jgi:Flp pilus assembly protein TadD
MRLGSAHMMRGDRSAAEAEFRRALQLGVDTPQVHRALAYLLAQQSRMDEALVHARLAHAQNPLSAQAAADVAKIAWAAGRREEASTAIESAIRLRPDVGEYQDLATQMGAHHP